MHEAYLVASICCGMTYVALVRAWHVMQQTFQSCFLLACRPIIDEELSPDKHLHKPTETAANKAGVPGGTTSKGSGPLTMPVPKTDLSAGQLTVLSRQAGVRHLHLQSAGVPPQNSVVLQHVLSP